MRWSGLLSWFFLWLHWSSPVFADPSLLQHISQQAERIESMRGEFRQTKTLGMLPQPIVSSGAFEFSQQQGIVWQTQQPLQNTLILKPVDATSLRDQSQKQTQNHLVGDLFMRLLTGDFTQLQQWFTLKVSGEQQAWTITLIPLSDALATYIKTITIAGGNYSESIIIEEQNGDRSDIQLLATHLNGQQVTD